MERIIFGIRGKLVKDGAKDIDLLVHSYYLGSPSPCVVIEDWVRKDVIGGHIDSVEQMFQQQVATHPGYVVKERQELVAVPVPKPAPPVEAQVIQE
jgi:hypothetical protein